MASRRAPGDGSVFYFRGRWRAELNIAAPGEPRDKVRRSFPTKRDAQSWLRTALVEGAPSPTAAPPTDAFVREFLAEWLRLRIESSDLAGNTRKSYADAVRLHIAPRIGDIRLSALRRSDVDKMLLSMAQAGLGTSSMRTCKIVTSLALKYAEQDGLVPRNVAADVAVPAAQSPRPKPGRVTVNLRDELLRALKDDPYFAAFTVMFLCGLRRGEAMGLRIRDIELDSGHIRVEQQVTYEKGAGLVIGPTKTQNVRAVGIPPRLTALLAARCDVARREHMLVSGGVADDALLFITATGRPVDPKVLNTRLQKAAESLGARSPGTHAGRRSFADVAHERGAKDRSLQSQIGHSSLAMTMGTYVSPSVEAQRDVPEAIDTSLDSIADLLT